MNTRTWIQSLSVAAGIVLGFAPQAFAANVALGKPVDLIGVFGTGSGYLGSGSLPPLPPASQITDGIAQSGAWTTGVWWDEHFTGVHNKIVVDLLGNYVVNGFGVMVDNNDAYLVEYRDVSGTWAPGWFVPSLPGSGLMWRSIDLPSPVMANAVRISAFPPSALGMDYAYSVSEMEVRAVPEPGTSALLAFGLLAAVAAHFWRRRPT